MSELKNQEVKEETAFIKVKIKYQSGRKSLSEFRLYEYDPDESWEKWKDIIFESNTVFGKINWYSNNVVVTKGLSFTEMIQLVKALESKFGISDKKLKQYLKDCGKTARGVPIKGFNKRGIEYTVLRGMNGSVTYKDLPNIPFNDMIFWKRMLDQEIVISQEHMKQNIIKLKTK